MTVNKKRKIHLHENMLSQEAIHFESDFNWFGVIWGELLHMAYVFREMGQLCNKPPENWHYTCGCKGLGG